MLTKPATAFSALQAVLMAASAGSFTHLVDDHFILDRRVVGGMQSVSVQMADELGSDTVRLNQPVRRIDWSDEGVTRSEEHTSELQSRFDLVCRLLLEKKKKNKSKTTTTATET